MTDSPLGLQLSLRSNANLSGYFCPRRAGTKIRENGSFSLTTRQAHASLVYPFLPRLCCHNKYRPTKADSTIESPLPSLKIQQLFHHRKQKTASKFSLLLLHFSCALHFDLLFDRPDFFQSQFDERFRTLSIFGYLTS